MQYEVLGFNQERVMLAELDLIDLMILRYIIQANGNPTMKHIVKDGISYVWLNHAKVLSDIPILRIKEGTFRNRLLSLKKAGWILSITDARLTGSEAYYSVSQDTVSFLNDDRCHSKMTSDTISNNSDIKTESNINTQQSLFTDNINKEELEVRNKGQKFVEDYNSICKSLPKCQRLTPRRSKGISNLLKKYSYEDILEVFNKLEASDFCTGKVNGWRADIDFILREDKFISALEGKYDNKGRCRAETITPGDKYRVSAEEKEKMRRAVERGEIEEY